MVCDDINDFERVELCTTNCKNVLLKNASIFVNYSINEITVYIRLCCSQFQNRPSARPPGICLEVCVQCIILSGNKQTVVQQLSDTLEIVIVFSLI